MFDFGEFKALFVLSKHERFVLIFLCSTLALGGALYGLRGTWKTQPEFRYAVSDSLYAQRTTSPVALANDSIYAPKTFNLNIITYNELMKLPKMTNEMAKRIIFYRAKHRRFKNYDDLKRVPGMTDELFTEISYYITLGN